MNNSENKKGRLTEFIHLRVTAEMKRRIKMQMEYLNNTLGIGASEQSVVRNAISRDPQYQQIDELVQGSEKPLT